MDIPQGFTPGPWREGQEGNLSVYGPDGMGEHSGLIAKVFKGRPNVALIAAAPDMAAEIERLRGALKDVIDAWDWWRADEYDRCVSVLGGAIADARAVLAEAPK